jgi:hypothetical protein
MKKLLLLFFLTTWHCSFAQELWPHENAEWWSEITYSLFTPAWYHDYVDGDTLIDGVQCTRLRRDHIFAFPNTPNDVQVQGTTVHYVYFDGDTLFWQYEEAFYPLLCFNAEVGDSWFPLPVSGIYPGCDIEPIEVTAVDSIEFNGEWYRQISIGGDGEQTDPFYWGGVFNERTYGSALNFPFYAMCDAIVEYIMYTFICYSDEDLSYANPNNWLNAPCPFFLNTSEQNMRALNIYPNPLPQGEILNVGEFDELVIHDLSGRLIWQTRKSMTSLEPNIVEGTYIVEITKDGKRYSAKLIVN